MESRMAQAQGVAIREALKEANVQTSSKEVSWPHFATVSLHLFVWVCFSLIKMVQYVCVAPWWYLCLSLVSVHNRACFLDTYSLYWKWKNHDNMWPHHLHEESYDKILMLQLLTCSYMVDKWSMACCIFLIKFEFCTVMYVTLCWLLILVLM